MATKNMLSSQTEAVLNKAIHAELFASNLYKHLANQLQRLGYFGAQKFFLAESSDELTHYQKLADYMNDRGACACVPAIEAIKDMVSGLREALETAFDTEIQLGNDYAKWYGQCDCVITQQFLLQFLEFQRKSIGEYGDLLARMDIVGDNRAALLIMDKELGE